MLNTQPDEVNSIEGSISTSLDMHASRTDLLRVSSPSMPRSRETKTLNSLAYAVVSHAEREATSSNQEAPAILDSEGPKHFVAACVAAIETLRSPHLITLSGNGRQLIIMCESNEVASIACLAISREKANRSLRRDMRDRLSALTSRAPNPRPPRRRAAPQDTPSP